MWIDATKELPKPIEGKTYSENVLAICNGILSVMCYCYVHGEHGGLSWADCYGDVNGDGYIEDDYNVTFWQPILSNEDREFLEKVK